MGVHIRWMIRRDVPDVLAIEQLSFQDPWTEGQFLEHLRKRNCVGMVAEDCRPHVDTVVGYMVYTLHKDKVELVNLAVHPAHRRRGVGGLMAAKLQGKLEAHRRNRLGVYVSDANLPAHLFFRRHGLEAVAVERDYFNSGDAYRFVYRAKEPAHAWSTTPIS